jgi:hypothetical protein
MFNRNDPTDLHTSQIDPEHDLDLVALFNNARTDQDVQDAMVKTRNRMRARHASSRERPSLFAFSIRRRG